MLSSQTSIFYLHHFSIPGSHCMLCSAWPSPAMRKLGSWGAVCYSFFSPRWNTTLIFPSYPLAWTAAQPTPSNSCQQGHCTTHCSWGQSRSHPWAVSNGPITVPDTPSWAGETAETGQDEAQWGEAGSDTATTWDGVGWGGWQPTGHMAGQSRDVINPEYGHRLGWQGAAGRGFWVGASGEASQGA